MKGVMVVTHAVFGRGAGSYFSLISHLEGHQDGGH